MVMFQFELSMHTLDDDLNDLSNMLVKSVNLHHSPSQEQSVVFFKIRNTMAGMNSRFADKLSIKKSTNYLIDNQSTALCPFSLFVLVLKFFRQSPQHETLFVNKSASLLSLLPYSLQEPTYDTILSKLRR